MTESFENSAGRLLAAVRNRAAFFDRAFPARSYPVRVSAFGTASYSFILSRVGPIGLITREGAQSALIVAGFAMGIIARDASGNMVRVP